MYHILDKSENEDTRAAAASAIWAATLNHDANLLLLSHSEIFPNLIAKIKYESEKVLAAILATTTNVLSVVPDAQELIRQQNVLPIVVDFLRSSHPPLLETTAGFLTTLMMINGSFFPFSYPFFFSERKEELLTKE